MHTSTSTFPRRGFTAGNLRAQFSPISRQARLTAIQRFAATNRLVTDSSAPAPKWHETPSPSGRTAAPRWWDPNLIDRLRSPLTRFHD